ncbi:MAG: hypothetical protein ACJAQT_000992 [Akkermansiaceae bacterium]
MIEVVVDLSGHDLGEVGEETKKSGDEIAEAKALGAGRFAEKIEEGAGGAAVFAVSEGGEDGGNEPDDGDNDGGEARGAPKPSVESFPVGEIPPGSEDDGSDEDDEEEGGEMSEEAMKLGWYFEGFDGEFGKPALQEAVGAELVAVDLMAGGPGDDEGAAGKKKEAPGVGKGETVACPAKEEGLGEEISKEEAEEDDDAGLPEEAGEGIASEFGERKEGRSEGEGDEGKVAPGNFGGDGRAIGLEAGEAAGDALGDGPGGVGGSADAFDFGLLDGEDFVDGQVVVEVEEVVIIEDAFVVFRIVVALAEAEAGNFSGGRVEDDEDVGGALVSVEVFL